MRHVSSALLVAAALCGCGSEPRVTAPLNALLQPTPTNTRYTVTYLPTLGGSRNRPTGINNRGWVAGFANRPGNGTRVAALWRDGRLDTLGTLGGPNSAVLWPGLDDPGRIAGIAETADLDPLHEEWSCTAFLPTVTGHICRGFFWQNGTMTPLPTLGGYQGFATGVNSRGQVVGWAETPLRDPTCNLPQQLQFRAVLWEPLKGTMQQLPPLHGDSTSAATAINERGQVVGISGECDVAVGEFSAQHSVLWDNGTVINIGDLGGDAWHTPMDINEQGHVVGFSNPAYVVGADFNPLAFLWTKQAGIESLGHLPNDTSSQALGINGRDEVVGVSTSLAGANRAFLWQADSMADLNDLVGPNFSDVLIVAQHINDAGVITGRAVRHGTNIQIPFVATPVAVAP